jgi:hypothetical protein
MSWTEAYLFSNIVAQACFCAGVIGYLLLSPNLRPCRSRYTIFASASRCYSI